MKPRPELLSAFKATTYNVHFADHVLSIRIGEVPLELNDLMIASEVGTWTFITAYNPLSEILPAKENAKRLELLDADLIEAGYETTPGESVADQGEWPSEKSVLVLGMNLDEASDLGRKHGQHAIVFGRFNKPAQLIWCNEND